jgi:hypothetical protein
VPSAVLEAAMSDPERLADIGKLGTRLVPTAGGRARTHGSMTPCVKRQGA